MKDTKVLTSVLLFTHVFIFAYGEIDNFSPVVKVSFGAGWKNVSSLVKSEQAYFVDYVDKYARCSHLHFTCEAPYQISLQVKGHIKPDEAIRVNSLNRDLVTNIYKITGRIDNAHWATLRVICYKIRDKRVARDILIVSKCSTSDSFVPSVTFLSLFGSPASFNLIPCPSRDPMLQVSLHKIHSNGNETLVPMDSLTYDFSEGFRSKHEFHGAYKCRQGKYWMDFTVFGTLYTISSHDEELVGTILGNLQAYCGQSEYCDTLLELTHLKIQPEYKSLIVESVTGKSSSYETGIVKVAFKRAFGLNLNDSGTVECKTTLKHRGVIITQSGTPLHRFFYDSYSQLVFLDSNYVRCMNPVYSAYHINCHNALECDLMLSCVQGDTNCNSKSNNVKVFGQRTIPKKFCIWEKRSHQEIDLRGKSSGVVLCGIDPHSRNLLRKWEYFTALDGVKYTFWSQVAENDLVRLNVLPERATFHTHDVIQFSCLAVKHLFVNRLTFELEYKNGSRIRLLGRNNDASDNGIENNNEAFINESLKIQLPPGSSKIHCMALWWNSTNVKTSSLHFETIHLEKPSFENYKNVTQLSYTFYLGEANCRLACIADGDPKLEYKWRFNGIPILDNFSNFNASVDYNGTAYLDFPKMEFRYAGKYECVATNPAGNASQTILVNILQEEDKITENATIKIVVVISVVLFILFLLAALSLALLTKKYRKAKCKIRNLTMTEVHNFFQGRAEVTGKLKTGTVTDIEKVDFLPYNDSLEIPLKNISFGDSGNNLLGSGQFGVVVKALILPEENPVAIKMPNSETDVTMFKSLLYEVKVMSYIGKHENIVALVGVCTEKIQSCTLYIATEICELGNLLKYLRNNKSSLINLVNDSQEVEMSLLPEHNPAEDNINTLDLIGFCHQIAKGMEHLALKKVVHADLAARNLLSANKVVKISDFGLSRKLYENRNYVKKSKIPLPWRWMAIESLRELSFSTCSDVWAYGVTLFEIFTLGDVPYPNETWSRDFVARLENGIRMDSPKSCSQEIYEQMVNCWKKEPEERPNFSQLWKFFDNLYKTNVNLLYIDMDNVYSP